VPSLRSRLDDLAQENLIVALLFVATMQAPRDRPVLRMWQAGLLFFTAAYGDGSACRWRRGYRAAFRLDNVIRFRGTAFVMGMVVVVSDLDSLKRLG
jgi:hypothetical protein